LPPFNDRWCFDLVLETHETILTGDEIHARALLVVGKKLDEIFQGAAQSGSGNGGIAPEAKITRLKLVAEPQSEIAVLRLARRLLEQQAERRQAQFQGGTASHVGSDTGIPEYAIDITSHVADEIDDAGGSGSKNAGTPVRSKRGRCVNGYALEHSVPRAILRTTLGMFAC
jgi:hypothetical protein